MPKKGGRRKKNRTHKQPLPEGVNTPEAQIENIPRSIVARVSKVSKPVAEIITDLRAMMGPYTASNLKERNYNRMKDYTTIAGHLGVSHLMMLSQTEKNVILRIARSPSGPTLHFRINQFMLASQIKAAQKRPFDSAAAFHTPPVLVLNNFSQSEDLQVKLMKVTFQHMFPTINVKTVKLSDCRRVVLFHYNKENETVEMRHYAIRANPVGISKNIKKVVQHKVPNLGNLKDISEYVDGTYVDAGSDSEMEDESSRVTLPERYIGRGNAKSQLSAMKLTELGPRLNLEIYKVEQGVGEGDILFHKFVKKSAEEAAAIKARVEKARKLKEERRKVQEENVKRKRAALEEKRKAKAERKRQRLENGEAGENEEDSESEEDLDDAELYDEDGEYLGDDQDVEEIDYEDEDENEEEEMESEGEDSEEDDD